MGNCLVTKLKNSVNNINLLKMGEIHITFKEAGTFALSGIDFQTATIISGTGRFEGGETSATIRGTLSVDGACVVSIPNKYDITQIISNGGAVNMNLLDYTENLTQINFYFSDLKGNFGKLKLDNVSNLRLYSCPKVELDISVLNSIVVPSSINLNQSNNVYGNVESLGNNDYISSLSFVNCTKVNGSVTKMLEDMVNKATPRTGSLSLDVSGTRVTATIDGEERDASWIGNASVEFTPTESIKVTITNSIGTIQYNGTSWNKVS